MQRRQDRTAVDLEIGLTAPEAAAFIMAWEVGLFGHEPSALAAVHRAGRVVCLLPSRTERPTESHDSSRSAAAYDPPRDRHLSVLRAHGPRMIDPGRASTGRSDGHHGMIARNDPTWGRGVCLIRGARCVLAHRVRTIQLRWRNGTCRHIRGLHASRRVAHHRRVRRLLRAPPSRWTPR